MANSSSGFLASDSAAFVIMVSFMIDAVSASVIGVMRCNIVLPAKHSL
jgi:hypothetical protein